MASKLSPEELKRRRDISRAMNLARDKFNPDKKGSEVCPYKEGPLMEAFKRVWIKLQAEYDEIQSRPKCPFCREPLDTLCSGLRCPNTQQCGYHTHFEVE